MEISLPTKHLSFSQVRSYLTCPACYAAQYVEGRPSTVTPALAMGSGVHAALDVCRRDFNSVNDPGRLWNVAEDAFDRSAEGVDRTGKVRSCERSGSSREWALAKGNCQRLIDDGVVPLIATERRAGMRYIGIESNLDYAGIWDFQFVGFADVIAIEPSGQTWIKDAKTSARWKKPDSWAALQLCLYSLAVGMPGDVMVGVDRLVPDGDYLYSPAKVAGGTAFQPSPQQKVEAWGLIQIVAEAITNKIFPAHPTQWQCRYDHPRFWWGLQ
jgi:hypothetical protein